MEPTTSAMAYTEISLPTLPIWAVALLLFVALPLAACGGFVAGNARRRRLLAANQPIDTVVGETTLGFIMAILGLLLAFSFAQAIDRANTRTTTLIDEAAAIGTAFLRTDYLPDPARTELQKALLDYARTRAIPEGFFQLNSMAEIQDFLNTSLDAQSRLWPLTLAATADPVPEPRKIFVAAAINEVLDAHLRRMRTLSQPVSEIAQSMVFAAALIALFILGNRYGVLGRPLTWRTFVLTGFMWAVMLTIIDTHRSTEGLIQVDDSTLRATIMEMEIALRQRG